MLTAPAGALTPPTVINPAAAERAKLQRLKDNPPKGENYILKAEQKMLEYKYPLAASPSPTSGLNYSTIVGWGEDDAPGWRPRWNNHPSPLHTDLYGGFASQTSGNDFDLITGRRAINESLQLGSIDTELNNWNDPDAQLLQDVNSRIEDYKRAARTYPRTLQDFSNITGATEAEVKTRANAVLQKALQANADFSALAKANSEDYSTSKQGGDLGWKKINQLALGVEDVCFRKSTVGKVYPQLVKATYNNYYIIKVTERRGTGTNLEARCSWIVFVIPAAGSDFSYLNSVSYDGKSQKISGLADKFVYQRSADGKSFTLQLKTAAPDATLTLADIKPLEVRSHPWTTMLGGKTVEKSPIFSLVPADHFLVYFSEASKIKELENSLRKITGPTESLFQTQEVVGLMEKVAKRLGIEQLDSLLPLVSEVAFVSEDLSFYPKTNYAVIFKPKTALGFPGVLVRPGTVKSEVSGYVVLTTSQRITESIQAAAGNQRASLADAEDFTYTLSVLEPRRDGVVYLSEAFITKLVGPEYRISARRRNAAIKALETLQYVSFAYRDLKGVWPTNIQQIANEGYLNAATVKDIERYRVDADGWVVHPEWGSLRDLASVGDVPITGITPSEKTTYERFRDGYQSFWREFFDPVGVAVTVSDQILLHTIILPLLDESQYNRMAEVFGGAPVTFDFIGKPHRVPAAQVVAKLNDLTGLLGDLILETTDDKAVLQKYEQDIKAVAQRYGVELSSDCLLGSDRRQRTCRDDLRRLHPNLNTKALLNDLGAVERAMVREIANKEIKKWLAWETPDDVFSFLGDEVMLGVGAQNSFSIDNLADLDVYAGLKLNQPEKAKEFLVKLFQKFGDEVGSGDRVRMGPFSFSTTEPLKNNYRGVEYAIIPTGFINAYYAFLDDTFYLTLSQLAMNKIIDASLDEAGKAWQERYSAPLQRGLAYTGLAHNLLLSADLGQLEGFKRDLTKEEYGASALERTLANKVDYLEEAATLANVLPGSDGTLANVAGVYYRNIPTELLGGKLSVRDGQATLTLNGTPYPLATLDSAAADKMMKAVWEQGKGPLLDSWNTVKNVGLGLTLSEDGLDARLAFTNPDQPNADPRFQLTGVPLPTPAPSPVAAPTKPSGLPAAAVAGLIALGVLLVAGGGLTVLLVRRHRGKTPLPPPESPLPPTENPPAEDTAPPPTETG